jgi:Tol biopolymer transport system component
MAEPLDFETTIAARLQARAATASRPFDAAAIASAAVATRPVQRLAVHWPTGAMRWALLAGAALLATLAGALLAAALLRGNYAGPWLAVARSGGVYLTHADGTEPRFLFASGNIVQLAWSSDGVYLMVMDHPGLNIVAEDYPPAPVTVLRTDGSVVWNRTVPTMPAWSNHGHRLAYVIDGDLLVTDVDTGVTQTFGGLNLSNPCCLTNIEFVDWSPDDSRIAATRSSVSHGSTVVLMPLGGGQAFETPAFGSDSMYPDWSPDGRYVSSWTGTGSLVFDTATGMIVGGLGDVGIRSQWSPDGSLLAWVEPGAWIHVARMPASGGGALRLDAFRLDASGVSDDGLVGWTRDGRSLLVLRENGTTEPPDSRPWRDLWQMDVDGSTPILLVKDISTAAMQPSATPTAPPRLAISTPLGVYIADADGTNRDVLVDAQPNARVDWSADGELLLITELDIGHAKVVRRDGSEAWQQSGIGGAWGVAEAAWSHQGHRVAWNPAGGVVVTDVDTGAKSVVDTGSRNWSQLAWSPDDRWIAGAEGHEGIGEVLMIAPSDGSAPAHPLPEATTKAISSLAWSPDGTSIAVVTVPCAATNDWTGCKWNLEILDATTGRRFDGIDGLGQGRPIWSPDGSRLSWAGPDETGKLTTVIVGTLPLEQNGADRFLPIAVNRWPVAWTPDGSALLVAQDPNPEWQGSASPNLWRVNPDSSGPVLLVEGASDGALQPTP